MDAYEQANDRMINAPPTRFKDARAEGALRAEGRGEEGDQAVRAGASDSGVTGTEAGRAR